MLKVGSQMTPFDLRCLLSAKCLLRMLNELSIAKSLSTKESQVPSGLKLFEENCCVRLILELL